MKGFTTDGILLPDKTVDLGRWAVVACDQYTSDPEYWETLSRYVGDAPSALNLILPERYLGAPDYKQRLNNIRLSSEKYLSDGILLPCGCGIVTERTTAGNRIRRGVMLSVNLGDYSYEPFSHAAVRATEGTVTERIPPRVEIRANSPLELPHIMLLADDREGVIDRLHKTRGKSLYSAELNMGGGRVAGYELTDRTDFTAELFDHAFSRFKEEFVFAVGDGNHSLAAAAALNKAKPNPLNEYALCEVVSVYEEGIAFEPIHRLVVADKPDRFVAFIRERVRGDGKAALYDGETVSSYSLPLGAIDAVKAVQTAIDEYAKEEKCTVDYVHGEAALKSAAARGGVGLVLPAMDKRDLFPYILREGVLPRKTFSIGEANEKRYYLEARRIV